jgi:hypothetical protein
MAGMPMQMRYIGFFCGVGVLDPRTWLFFGGLLLLLHWHGFNFPGLLLLIRVYGFIFPGLLLLSPLHGFIFPGCCS